MHILACTQIHVHVHMSRNVCVGGEWDAASWNFSPYNQACHCWPVNSVSCRICGHDFSVPHYQISVVLPSNQCWAWISYNYHVVFHILHEAVHVNQYTCYLNFLSHKIPGPHSHFRTWNLTSKYISYICLFKFTTHCQCAYASCVVISRRSHFLSTCTLWLNGL